MVDFTPEEREYIAELLKTSHDQLIHELNHTDTRSFEEVLRRRIAINEQLAAKLKQANG